VALQDLTPNTLSHILNRPIGNGDPCKKKVQIVLESYGIEFPLPHINGGPHYKDKGQQLNLDKWINNRFQRRIFL